MTTKLEFSTYETVDSIVSTLPLINQQYPDVDATKLRLSVAEMIDVNNYKMLAVLDNGRVIAVCGYWILRMIYCGRYLQMSNLIVDLSYRNKGVASQIVDYFTELAKKSRCDKIVLDSNILNKKSHSLFFNNDFYIRGFHFMKDLNND